MTGPELDPDAIDPDDLTPDDGTQDPDAPGDGTDE